MKLKTAIKGWYSRIKYDPDLSKVGKLFMLLSSALVIPIVMIMIREPKEK